MSYDGEQTPISFSRLLEQVPRRMRLEHYSLRTGQAYLHRIRRCIRAYLQQHPRERT